MTIHYDAGHMETQTVTPVGRPRNQQIDASVMAATAELIAERGYNGTSLAAVAERAGTTTPAIYRRWSSKQDLVLDAVFGTSGDEVVASTGDLEADVATMIRWTMERLGSPVGRAALAGLLGEPQTTSASAHRHLALLWDRHRANLDQWRQAGLVRSDLDVTAFLAAVAGPAIFMGAVIGAPADDPAVVDRLAHLAIEGIRATDTTIGEAHP